MSDIDVIGEARRVMVVLAGGGGDLTASSGWIEIMTDVTTLTPASESMPGGTTNVGAALGSIFAGLINAGSILARIVTGTVELAAEALAAASASLGSTLAAAPMSIFCTARSNVAPEIATVAPTSIPFETAVPTLPSRFIIALAASVFFCAICALSAVSLEDTLDGGEMAAAVKATVSTSCTKTLTRSSPADRYVSLPRLPRISEA